MENNHDKKQELLSGVKSGRGTDDVPPGGELIYPWQRLAEHLSPLIGESGFCALYGRAVWLVVPHFAWLQAVRPGKNAEQSFIVLTGAYRSVDVEAASAANTVLLTTFTELLSSLIGEALTGRLLDLAWDTSHEHKHAQEQKD